MTAPDNGEGPVAEGTIPALAVLGSDAGVTGWSRSAEELLGYSAEEAFGRPGFAFRVEGAQTTRIWDWTGGTGTPRYRKGLIDLRDRDGGVTLALAESSEISIPGGDHAWVVRMIPAGAGGSGLSTLEPLLTGAPVVMAVWDRQLRFVWMNQGAQGLRDVFPYFEIGRLLEEGCDEEAPVPPELIRKVLDDGRPVLDREARWVSSDRSRERAYSTFLFRVEGVDADPLGVCMMAVDVTDSKASRRLALLRQASVRVGTTLDVKKTAQELADLAMPAFADYVAVDLAESVLPGFEPLERLDVPEAQVPAFRRAGLATVMPEVPEFLQAEGQAIFVPEKSPFTQVLDSGRSYLEPELDTRPGSWLARDSRRAEVVRDSGMHSAIIVPLKARGATLGIAMFIRTVNQTSFTWDDLMLAEELADRAALSLDNARQYTREHTAALALQRQLLPRKLAGGNSVELAWRYLPSDIQGVGGDWYDAIMLDDSRVALVVGDVTGHGINAAASMGRLRTAVRTLAYLGLQPQELLNRLDDLYAREADEEDGAGESPLAATLLYALYDPATRQCTMASAGHLPPAIVDPAMAVSFPDLPIGTPIGLGLGAHEAVELQLDVGSLMVLYTDGLIERRESDLDTGMQRLSAALGQAMSPLEDLCSSVIDAMVSDAADDDVTLLLARTLEPDS